MLNNNSSNNNNNKQKGREWRVRVVKEGLTEEVVFGLRHKSFSTQKIRDRAL